MELALVHSMSLPGASSSPGAGMLPFDSSSEEGTPRQRPGPRRRTLRVRNSDKVLRPLPLWMPLTPAGMWQREERDPDRVS